jgi:uncharacterized iron-regulated membrane protein
MTPLDIILIVIAALSWVAFLMREYQSDRKIERLLDRIQAGNPDASADKRRRDAERAKADAERKAEEQESDKQMQAVADFQVKLDMELAQLSADAQGATIRLGGGN